MNNSIRSNQDASPRLSRESCYRALAAKDSRFDGVFFTGIKTTGIYCRPVCTVKTPRESSCEFFCTAAAAEAAGFRPCLRCRPELAPYALQQNLAHAVWQRIAAGALNDGDCERLSAEVGLSSRQLRRVLIQHFGVTPIELAQTQRLLFAKKLLQETNLSMTELAYASGFGSVRRFNALFAARYGLAPTAIRRAVIKADPDGPDGLTLRLAYRPLFAWTEILRYLGSRAIPGVEAIDHACNEGSYARSVRINDFSGWLRVTHLPSAQRLADASVANIAEIGLPATRAETIRNLAQFAAKDGLNLKPGATLDDAVAHLKTVRGIGEWTAQYIALRALRFPDAFPAGDLGLQKAAAAAPNGRLSEKQLAARAACWAPWRAYAALLLWHSL